MTESLECQGADLHGLGRSLADAGASFRVEVRGFSMYPFLRDGDEVEVEPVLISEVELGDVVFFRSGDRLLAHRVVQVITDDQAPHLRVRGDSFLQEDPPVSETNLVGQVTVVYRRQRMRERTIRLERGPAKWYGILMARSRITHRCVRALVRVASGGENVVKGLLISGAGRQAEGAVVPEEEQRQ